MKENHSIKCNEKYKELIKDDNNQVINITKIVENKDINYNNIEKNNTNNEEKIDTNIILDNNPFINKNEKNFIIKDKKIEITNETNSINIEFNNNINNLTEFDNFLKNYFIENKNNIKKPKDFINYGNLVYYKLNLKEKFKLAEYHIKNLYYKYKNSLLPKTLSDIYAYANSFIDIGPIAKSF